MITIGGSSNNKWINMLIESNGIPNIIKTLVEEIFIEYKSNENIFYDDNIKTVHVITIYNGLFFNKLNIVIEINHKNVELDSFYKPELSNWIGNKFDSISIMINVIDDDISEIKELLSHELLHAYEDYSRKIGNNKGFRDLDGEYYSPNTPKLLKIKDKFKNDRLLLMLMNFLYYLLNPEKRANITQLYFELKKHKFSKNDINNKKYENLTYYKNYKTIRDSSEKILDSLNENQLSLLLEYIKETTLKRMATLNLNTFKLNLINYFKEESEYVMRKMHKIMIEYLEDDYLMEVNDMFLKHRMFEIIKTIEK